jgi:copper homeostasis protein
MSGLLVECCVVGLGSVLAACEGGADRVELCEHIGCGGVTPSAGVIDWACRLAAIPVHVLIRPRPGDYVYSERELDVMLGDIEAAKSRGARGVVIGALDAAGRIAREQIRILANAARPMTITFHRAFDEVRDMERSLDDLTELGIDRVLTSGGAATARRGLEGLERLVHAARGRIGILAAGRVRMGDLGRLASVGIREVHVGSATWVERESGWSETDAGRVRRITRAAHAARLGSGE